MGYRSCGAMIIHGPEEKLVSFMASQRLVGMHKCVLEEGTIKSGLDGGKAAYVLEFGSWKWYDSYEDIQCFEQLWANASTQEGLSGWRWRRGEDDDDIETDDFGHDRLGSHKIWFEVEMGVTVENKPYADGGALIAFLGESREGTKMEEIAAFFGDFFQFGRYEMHTDGEIAEFGFSLTAVGDEANSRFLAMMESPDREKIFVESGYCIYGESGPSCSGATQLDSDSRIFTCATFDHPFLA